MAEILDKFTNTQLFWLLIFLIVVLSEVIKAAVRQVLSPLRVWMRAQNRKALRDKFAANALQGLIVWDHSPQRNGSEAISIADLCYDAYRYADAMMEARRDKEIDEWMENEMKEVRNG